MQEMGGMQIQEADQLLEDIEMTLYEMSRLTKWVADNDLTGEQRRRIQRKIDLLVKNINEIADMLQAPIETIH